VGSGKIEGKERGRRMDALSEMFTKALHIEEPWRIANVEFNAEGKRLDIRIDFPKGSEFACPKCGRQAKAYDTTEKTWRHMNFFEHECYLVARVPRIECPDDGVLKVTVPWARKGADFTLLFESLSMLLCREMPVNTVSRILGVDDNKLWRMLHYYVDKARKASSYKGLRSLGIDETSIRKGHDYVTLGVDIDGRRTVFVGEGKDAEVVRQLRLELSEYGCDPDGIKRLSIDMSPAFISGCKENFPRASMVFDRFHVMKILNEAVDMVRRDEVYEQSILRKTRHLWLKNRRNLTSRQARLLQSMESMPRLNLKTMRAFHMRENFQGLYNEQTQDAFEQGLDRWYFWATHSRIPRMIDAAKTIQRHWDGIVNWYEGRISNGLLEGLNSLIQAAKAKARGYRTFRTFKTVVFLLTGKLDFSKVGLPT
jgi:transposase